MQSQEGNRKTYWKTYWNDNKEKILEKRRQKYAEDPRYRSQLKEVRERNYQKKRIVKKRTPELCEDHNFVADVLKINGVDCVCFDTKYLSVAIGRSIALIRSWEQRGIIPKSPLFCGRRRMFTQKMIDAVKNAIKNQNYPANLDTQELKRYVYVNWDWDSLKID